LKQMGAIPADYRAADGKLVIGGLPASELVEQAGGTPLFVYDLAIVRARIERLRATMPSALGLHYAIKANPFPPLLRAMQPLVDGFDVASAGELRTAINAGMVAGHISFAGPGKRDEELAAAIAAGATINLESEGEARRALRIAERLGSPPRLAVRVNPDFELKGAGMRMGGGAKPFGVDAERVPALVRELLSAGAEWRGFHIFAGSQNLDAASVASALQLAFALSGRMADAVGRAPPLVNLGGGFGVPYFHGDALLDVEQVGGEVAKWLPVAGPTRFAVELGRWLVGEAGVYLTRVVDRKESGGQTFLIVDGGLHHQLAASGNFGTVVRRNYPLAVATRFGDAADEVVNVHGCLCTPLDRLGEQVKLPRAQVGDLIAVFMAGAYGATASPAAFLGHPPAREMLV
jgi:diaminopimelate decarboxylase